MRRAVLFDLYDTLVRVDIPGVIESRARIAAACNVDVEQFQALWNQNMAQRMLGSLGSLEDEITAMLCTLHDEVDAELLDRTLIAQLAAGDRTAWAAAARLYPDTLSTLVTVRERGFTLAIVSNCSCQAADVIQTTGLDRKVDALALSFELGVAKPDPAIFLAASERLAVSPDECLFVADGAGGELEAAHALGMLSVWVERPGERRRSPEPPAYDTRIERLAELSNLDAITNVGLEARF